MIGRMNAQVLIVPGFGNSGAAHWQSRWEAMHAGYVRVHQDDWMNPVRDAWVEGLDRAIVRARSKVVLVAHSLGSLTTAWWASQHSGQVVGALLVAPPDPDALEFPKSIVGFSGVPLSALPFPSIAVLSDDDPYDPHGRGAQMATGWGSRVEHVGARGHINGQSGLGDWPEGLALLRSLLST